MSTTAINDNNMSISISEIDDINMFHAALQRGRRNAVANLEEQLALCKIFSFCSRL